MTKDMTSGNIPHKLLTFLFPVFMASLLQQLYSMADSVIVGRFIGKEAFAAVGSTGSLNFLIIGTKNKRPVIPSIIRQVFLSKYIGIIGLKSIVMIQNIINKVVFLSLNKTANKPAQIMTAHLRT